MNIIHLMVGIQGSGKSTFSNKLSKELNIKIVSTDMVRQTVENIKEEDVWPTVYKMCAEELKNGKDVIFDATSITPKVRNRLIDNVKNYYENFEVGCYFFDVDPLICKKRVELRNQDKNELYLPVEVIDSYHERLIKPTIFEGFVFVKTINEVGIVIGEEKQC